nr:unnamed protein product [Callosobruchus analis]
MKPNFDLPTFICNWFIPNNSRGFVSCVAAYSVPNYYMCN